MAKLTAAEIRKLIKAHNVLTKITIPKGATRDDLIKLVEKKGYTVNHESKLITRKIGKKTETITLENAKAIAKPKPLTEEQKKKRQQAKQKKAGEKAFLKKAIPAPPPVSKPSKGVKVGKPPPKKVAPPPKVKKVIKEDEVRPARKAAPPIPRARDFVKIGKKPEGRIDTGGSRNVGKVDNTKPKKKEKKKFPKVAEGAVAKAIKAKKEAKKAAKDKPDFPYFEEKILTQDEKFLDFLNTVGFALGRSQTGEKGALEFTNNRKVKRVMKVIEPIVENKKTSKFTKKEKEGIKDALNYYVKSISPERKEDHKVFTQMVKNIEDYNSVSEPKQKN
jgi:hypothetical protein